MDGVNERRKHEATESALHKPIPRRGGYHEKLRLSNIGAAPHPPAPELNRPTPTHASCPLAVCTSHMCPQTLPQTYQGTNPYHAPDRDIPQTERPSRLTETRGASDSGLRGSLRLLRHPDATHDARTTCVTRASTMACLRRPGVLCMRACSTLTSRHNAHTAGRQRSLGAVNARHDALSGPAREHLPRPPRAARACGARAAHRAGGLASTYGSLLRRPPALSVLLTCRCRLWLPRTR